MSEASPPWLPAGRGSALEPLDGALELMRTRLSTLLPIYVLAVVPLAAGGWLAIDAVTARDRAALVLVSAVLTLALPWRWAWLAVLQRRVQAELRGQPPLPVSHRLPAILIARLVAAFMLTWGIPLMVLPFWGIFFGGFAAPALLERDRRAMSELVQTLRWIGGAVGRLMRIALTLSIAGLVGLLAGVVLQVFLIQTILPSLLGIDTTGLLLTMQSTAWWMGFAFLFFLVFDFYWSIAAVTVFYDIQSRRLGSDLRWRLARLREAAP